MASGHMLTITGNSLFEPLFFNQRPDRKDGLLLGPPKSEDSSLFEQKWKIKVFFQSKDFQKQTLIIKISVLYCQKHLLKAVLNEFNPDTT